MDWSCRLPISWLVSLSRFSHSFFKYASVSVIFQRLQQEKEHLSSEGLLEVMMRRLPRFPQLRVITAQDGAALMTFNQLEITTAQSLMVTKSTSLVELEQSKFSFFESLNVFWKFVIPFFKIYRNLERRWRFKEHQTGWSKTGLLLWPRIGLGWC